MALGAWMIVSPQALLGLDQLKWMYRYAFPGEVVLGAMVMTASLYLMTPVVSADPLEAVAEKRAPRSESSTTSKEQNLGEPAFGGKRD